MTQQCQATLSEVGLLNSFRFGDDSLNTEQLKVSDFKNVKRKQDWEALIVDQMD